jgi:uncharacterized membrane protein
MTKHFVMRGVLDFVGGAIFIGWIVIYFGYNGEASTHILLVLAIFVFFVKLFLYLPKKRIRN